MGKESDAVQHHGAHVTASRSGGDAAVTKAPDALSDPLQASLLADPVAVKAAVDPGAQLAPAPSLTTPSVTPAPSLTTPPATATPTLPAASTPAPKTKASVGGGKSNKPAKTWAERNDAKPWDVTYDAFATEGHTSHHLIPDNSLLSLGKHITKMGLWGQEDTAAFADEFILRDVMNHTDPSKQADLKDKVANYKAKTKRTTGELGGATEVEDTGLQGVLHDGMSEALDDDDLKEFAKKFQGAFEWRPANTVLGPTSSLRWDDPKEGFDVPATLLAYGDKGMTEEIAQNSKNIKDFVGDEDTATAPKKLATIMKGLTKQNRAGEQLTGKDAAGKPLPFMTDRSDWVAQNKSNKGDLDAYDATTTSMMEKARASSGGDKAATSIETSRAKKRPTLVSKDGFVTDTDADDVADIRSRLGV